MWNAKEAMEAYKRLVDDTNRLYADKIYPDVSKIFDLMLETVILPDLKELFESMKEHAESTSVVKPLKELVVTYKCDYDNGKESFQFYKKKQVILSIRANFKTKGYVLDRTILERVCIEYLKENGITGFFKSSQNTRFLYCFIAEESKD